MPLQQFENQRTHIAGAAEFLASQRLFWEERANRKRVAPQTPMQSGSGTPAVDHDAAPSGATGSDALGPSLVQPVTVQDEAAFAFTAADQGVDINVAANLQNWLTTPVQTNRDVLRLVRSYHKQVIRPEYYNIAIQLETSTSTTRFSRQRGNWPGCQPTTAPSRSIWQDYNSSPQDGQQVFVQSNDFTLLGGCCNRSRP